MLDDEQKTPAIILGSLHPSTPLGPRILPQAPSSLHACHHIYSSLSALRPFLTCITPQSISTARTLFLGCNIQCQLVRQSQRSHLGSIHLWHQCRKRSSSTYPPKLVIELFDVFYYLLTSASTPAEREFLGLKHPSRYSPVEQVEHVRPSIIPTICR